MSIFSKKKKVISDDAKSSERDMNVEVVIRVRTDEQYSNKTVAEVKVEKSMLSTTDTKSKDIIDEIEQVVSGAISETEAQVENSRWLSEGYHAAQRKEDEESL